MVKLFYVWFLLKTSLCGCVIEKKDNNFIKVNSKYQVQRAGKLSKGIGESSGLALTGNKNTYWTINDSGGGTDLFEINSAGNIMDTKEIRNVANHDWEDLSSGREGELYIGDTGNNSFNRESVQIYILNNQSELTGTIHFSYEPSESNPAGREDCEAFFYSEDYLYLFTKSPEMNGGLVRLYRLPAKPGVFTAELLDQITINGQVTSADISPDGKEFVLLTYGKLLFFDISNGKIDFKSPAGCLKMVRKQTEAILYLNQDELLITNEQRTVFKLSYRGR